MYKSIAVVGCGLIGGSLAKLVREVFPTMHIVGIDLPSTTEILRKSGIFSEVQAADKPHEAVKDDELTILSLPCKTIIEILPAVMEAAAEGSVVMDTGSVKVPIIKAAGVSKSRAHFIGGHPIGGSHGRGFDVSSADLLRGIKFVVTPGENIPPSVMRNHINFLERLGFKVIGMDAEKHDRMVAYTSHLPQAVSAALTNTAYGAGSPDIAGPGLASATRLAASPAEMWNEIYTLNRSNVIDALNKFSDELNMVIGEIQEGDITASFSRAAELRGSSLDEF